MRDESLDFLHTLENVIGQRIAEPTTGSYTANLVASGNKRVAQKVGEEALELALASVAGDRTEQLSEAADLVYHLLVLLRTQNLCLGDVAGILQERHQE